MCVVFVFLILLVLAIHVLSRVLAQYTAIELEEIQAALKRQAGAPTRSETKRRRIVAAISAAIATHRAARPG
jgi:sodium pump decarboxylase gamma subunit